jgi:hypothetical protein
VNDSRVTEYQARAAMVQPVPFPLLERPQPAADRADAPSARAVDDAGEGSFPASDPPSWTSSIVRPAPDNRRAPQRTAAAATLRALARRVAAFF